ncbi:MAG TPA: hypothetical protein VGZ48_12175 [Candidatus Acidoferrales bacterium]|nr:hypothetical protein [Candidatus Acidoferrales bacterium]
MSTLVRGVAVLCTIAALMAGCKSSTGSDSAAATSGGSGAQSGKKAGAATYVAGSSLSNQLTTAMITDPSLNNMVSATLTIPAGWKLQGITMVSPCTFSPWPVFRAFSPEGLMQMRIEPVIGWQWHPNEKGTFNSGCANISGQTSAAAFLQYYLGTMQGGVHAVGPMTVPSRYSQWAQGLAAQKNQGNSSVAPAMQTQNTADTAAMRIEVVNGSFVVEERLRTVVECTMRNDRSTAMSNALYGGTCWARLDVLTAPLGQLDALVQLVDSNNLPHGVNSPQWTQAALQRQQQQGAQALAALTAQEKQESQMIYQQFQQIMQRSQAQHQAFMQQQESQFESAMNNANASMNARSTIASDWVDYSLDQQTVMTQNGSMAKVSSSYSQTWTNGTQWYQTNDPNSNPNGVLSGNWTQTTQVHGNGAPK